MPKTGMPRTPEEIAVIQAQLQVLADNPGRVERMRGRRELEGTRGLPRDTRRHTDATGRQRYLADYSVPNGDRDDHYGSGLL